MGDNATMRTFFVSAVFILVLVRPTAAADFATEVMDATFKLFHPESTSTCFLLREGEAYSACYLVTTAHTLERAKGETATVVLRQRKPDGTFARLDHVTPIREGEKPLWTRHGKQDVAVLKLSGDLPVSVAALPVACLADEERIKAADVHICSRLFVLTYPERLEAHAAGLPIARQGIFASPPTLPSNVYPTFLADYTAFAGDSGGPVFIPTSGDAGPLVVGMVTGQYNHDEKIETRYEQRLIKHPLGLGIVVHARFIRETVDLAAGGE
jgi:hypothetical protein